MDIFQIVLVLSAFLCSLVAGLLFAYAVVVMPGLKSLDNKAFIRAFQVTDQVIQNNQPLFIFVWVGSAIAVMISAVMGFWRLQGVDFYILILATLAYIVGVQLSTIVIHLPLNNKLQLLDVDSMDEADLQIARKGFESRWNKSNLVRTAISCCVSALLVILLVRL